MRKFVGLMAVAVAVSVGASAAHAASFKLFNTNNRPSRDRALVRREGHNMYARCIKAAAAAAVATIVSLGATTAQAVTITVQSGGADTAISVSCDADCNGVVSDFAPAVTAGAGQLSNSIADLFDIGPGSSEADEVGAINTLFGTSFTVDDADKTEFTPSEDDHTFDSTAEFIAFAIGGGTLDGKHFFIKLLFPVPVTVTFLNDGQTSGGLSHLTEIGTTVIPLPAGLILFLTGLGGIGVLGRYKAKRRGPAVA